MNFKISVSIGLVTEEELVQKDRVKRFPRRAVPPVLSLDGKAFKYHNYKP